MAQKSAVHVFKPGTGLSDTMCGEWIRHSRNSRGTHKIKEATCKRCVERANHRNKVVLNRIEKGLVAK